MPTLAFILVLSTTPLRAIRFLFRITLPFVAFAGFFTQSNGHAQPISFERLGTSQGMSQSTVHSLYQDADGFVWIATRDGLNRYDGQTFESFRRHPRQAGSLQSSDVSVLAGGQDGRLWVGTTNGGLHRLNPDGKTFTHFRQTTDQTDVSHWTINCLAEDDRHRIWAGTSDGGWLVVDSRDQVRQYRLNTSSSEQLEINAVIKDKDQSLWFGLENGTIVHLPKGENQWKTFRIPGSQPSTTDFDVKSLLRDHRGNLWVGTQNRGLYQFIESSGQFIQAFNEPGVFEKGNFIKCLTEDAEHNLWIGTDDGIRLLRNGNSQDWLGLHPDPTNDRSLSSHAIKSLLTDRRGNVWVGTWEGGLNVWYAEPMRFETIKASPVGLRRLLVPKVSALTADQHGDLWVGSVRGLLRFPHNGQPMQTVPIPPAFDSRDVYALFTDRLGYVYASYWNGGVARYGADGSIKEIGISIPAARHVISFAQEANGKVWMVRQDHQLLLYDPRTDRIVPIADLTAQFHLPRTMNTTCLLEGQHGWLWFGTYTNGLIGWNRATGQVRHYQASTRPGSLSDDHINCLYEDKTGRIWMGTNGGGLNCLLPGTDRFRLFTTQQGLAGDVVTSLAEDLLGNLWLGTTRGLTRLTLATERFVSFNEDDGLPTPEFTNLTGIRLRTGEVAFGTSQGLVVLHPERFNDTPLPPQAYLSELKLFNRSVGIGRPDDPLNQALYKTSQVELTPQQTVFTLRFGALSYSRNRHVRFAYRLDQFDPDWNYLDKQENATYTNLEPGRYLFRLKAAQSGQPWGPEKKLVVVIQPPWFKTRWAAAFYIFFLLGVLGLIRQIIRIREKLKADIRIQELKTESIRQLEQVRTSFFTNISHEFRTPLTLIITPLEKLLTEELPSADRLHHQLGLMNRHANRLLRLISQLLDLSKIESGSIKPQLSLGNLCQHLENIGHAFDELATSKTAQLQLLIHPDLREAYYDADITEKILSNLLSNALKHISAGGMVTVEASVQQQDMLLTVTDTGVGIPADEMPRIFERFYQGKAPQPLGTGVGLALTKELVELLKGTIQVFSTPGLGCRFVVTLPIHRASFPPEWLSLSALEPTHPSGEIPLPTDGHRSTSAPMLLVAEDDPDLRRYLVDCFTDAYFVLEACDGQQALEMTLQHLPDIVITDWMMPLVEGPEVCRQLKMDQRTSHIPVVLLTAKSSPPNQLVGVQSGADDYLTKPFSAALLKSRVHNLVENRQRLRRAFSQEVWLRPSDVKLTPLDELFLQRATALVEEHMDEPHFDAEQLQEAMNLSQMQLYRKLKSLTDLSARDFIRHIRIQRASQLLQTSQLTVSEIAYRVGFNDPSYFGRCFKKQFSKTPQEYATGK